MWIDVKTGLFISIAFFVGLLLGHMLHPYESCKRMYETPENISECVWILEKEE